MEVTLPEAMPVRESLGAAAGIAAVPEGLITPLVVELEGASAVVLDSGVPLLRALVIVPVMR
jgi:hypothetical protein